MLSEIKNARQIEGEGRRRWFRDENFDLIVWYTSSEQIDGFQLCYDTGSNEKALTWRRAGGFRHEKVDSGDVPGGMSRTPILIADGSFDKKQVAARFLANSSKLPEELRKLVAAKIEDYFE